MKNDCWCQVVQYMIGGVDVSTFRALFEHFSSSIGKGLRQAMIRSVPCHVAPQQQVAKRDTLRQRARIIVKSRSQVLGGVAIPGIVVKKKRNKSKCDIAAKIPQSKEEGRPFYVVARVCNCSLHSNLVNIDGDRCDPRAKLYSLGSGDSALYDTSS